MAGVVGTNPDNGRSRVLVAWDRQTASNVTGYELLLREVKAGGRGDYFTTLQTIRVAQPTSGSGVKHTVEMPDSERRMGDAGRGFVFMLYAKTSDQTRKRMTGRSVFYHRQPRAHTWCLITGATIDTTVLWSRTSLKAISLGATATERTIGRRTPLTTRIKEASNLGYDTVSTLDQVAKRDAKGLVSGYTVKVVVQDLEGKGRKRQARTISVAAEVNEIRSLMQEAGKNGGKVYDQCTW